MGWQDAPEVGGKDAWMSAPEVDAEPVKKDRFAAGRQAHDRMVQNTKDEILGALRGAGSIGATIMYPVDRITDMIKGDRGPNVSGLVTGQQPVSRNEERRQQMDEAANALGANPDAGLFRAAKLGAETLGTAGVGGLLGRVASAARAPQTVVNALSSSGFRTGATPTTLAGKFGDVALRAGAGAVTGGASAGIVDPESAKTGAVIGGALPPITATAGAAGRGIRNVLTGGGASTEVQALASRAKELGIDVPADRLVDSKPLNAIAAGLNYVPGSGRAATERRMQEQLNQALSRTFGQDSPNVTQSLRKASSELGGKFDAALKGHTVGFDKQLLDEIGEIQQTASKELGKDGLSAINAQIDELVSKGANGQIDGQAAYNIKRSLDRIGQRNSPEAYHARELKKALMGALDRSMGPEEAQAFANVRKQYGNMLALENLAKNGAEGDVSIARVANLKNINNQDLQELADIAAQFLKPREGQHGAAQRAFAGLGIGGTAGLPALAGTVAAGRLTNTALNSSAVRNALMRPATEPLTSLDLDRLGQLFYRAAPVAGSR